MEGWFISSQTVLFQMTTSEKNTLQPFLLLACPAVLAQTLYNGVTEWQ